MTARHQLLIDLTSPLPSLDDYQLRLWAKGKTVMISSTMRDLGPEREAVAQVVSEMGAEPRYFERFSAPGDPAQVYRPEVSRADIYLFIAGERYGAPINGDSLRRSATHLEYDTAYAAYKPVLAYNKRGVQREQCMSDLVNVLEERHTVTRFQEIAELKAAVREGLRRLAEAQSTTWVKLGDAVFPVRTVNMSPLQGPSWQREQQSRQLTMTASLRDPQIIGVLGPKYQAEPLTFDSQIYEADQIGVHESRTGRYDAVQTIELVARPGRAETLAIIPISNGESGDEQLEAAMNSLLFGKTPPLNPNGVHTFKRSLRPIGSKLGELHRQLSAHHRDAELFVPIAELFLTDRLLRGTHQDPAPLTQLLYLSVTPVVDSRVSVRVQGIHSQSPYSSTPLHITCEGVIDFRGPEPTGIDSW